MARGRTWFFPAELENGNRFLRAFATQPDLRDRFMRVTFVDEVARCQRFARV